MGDESNNTQRSDADAQLEREVRKDRKFSLTEAIGRLAGPGAMKGISPIPRQQQAAAEIENWLRANTPGGNSELEVVILRYVRDNELLLHNLDQPLIVLAAFCQRVLDSDFLLKELVREADVEWGQVNDEKPYFEIEGSPPDPRDPYTLASVRKVLTEFMEHLARAV